MSSLKELKNSRWGHPGTHVDKPIPAIKSYNNFERIICQVT